MRLLLINLVLVFCGVIIQPINAQETKSHLEKGMEAAVKDDYLTAHKEFMAGALLNDKYCCGRLAAMYYYGVGIKSDVIEAKKWATKGYELGNSYSAAILGLLSCFGDNVDEQNYIKARPLLLFAYTADDAELENEELYANVGVLILLGYLFEDDDENAELWIGRVLHDYPNFANGYGVASLYYLDKEDYEKAVKYATIADQSDNINGIYTLGYCMTYGRSMVKNIDNGIKRLRKAALLGQVDAMEELGDIYSEGKLVPKDVQEAMQWYKKASDAGSDDAEEKYDMLNNND